MHESMIPKADKKELKHKTDKKTIKSQAPFSPTQHESLAVKIKRHVSQYVY